MRKVIMVCAGVLLLNAQASAQSISPNLTKGTESLLFSFGGFSNLTAGNFDGGIGAKYYFKDRAALRLGVQIATADQDIPANPGPGQQGTDGEASGSRLGVSAALELHRGTGRANVYLGGGVGFSKASTEVKSPVIGPSTNQTIVKNDRNGESINGITFLAGTGFNLFALAGAEFFLFQEVSLAAEYRLGFAKLSRSDEEVTSGNQTTTTKVGASSGIGVNSAERRCSDLGGLFLNVFHFCNFPKAFQTLLKRLGQNGLQKRAEQDIDVAISLCVNPRPRWFFCFSGESLLRRRPFPGFRIIIGKRKIRHNTSCSGVCMPLKRRPAMAMTPPFIICSLKLIPLRVQLRAK
jgi:opacity protein-like surface antigen